MALATAQGVYMSPWPPIASSLTFGSTHVAPLAWDGVDPDAPNFVPVVVSVTASASDTDTYWFLWLPFEFWTYMNILDVLGSSELTGPSGFTLTQATLGNASGQFSTVDCANQTETMVEQTFQWEVDDLPQMENDDPVSLAKSIYVVLPNAAQTTHYHHEILGAMHCGDCFVHTVFYRPSDESATHPAPSVSFSRFTVEEGDWLLLSVDESQGLSREDVERLFQAESPFWNVSWILTNASSLTDCNWMNRWTLAELYGESLKNPGTFVLRQGFRVTSPVTGPWWYHEIEMHLVGYATSAADPGECYPHKESYSRTSLSKPFVKCSTAP